MTDFETGFRAATDVLEQAKEHIEGEFLGPHREDALRLFGSTLGRGIHALQTLLQNGSVRRAAENGDTRILVHFEASVKFGTK